MRYFIELSYKGTNYHGWQIQPNAITVQEVLEKALSMLLRKKIGVAGAGRTDTGVHAKFYVAHFEIDTEIKNVENFIFKINRFLPYDISISKIYKVADDMHARFSAKSRTYEYHISTKKNPFLDEFSTYIYGKMNIEKMREATNILFDYIDFTSFSKSKTATKTNNCKILQANWTEKNGMLIFTIKADRFLRNMVRAIVGTLLEVAYEKCSIEEFKNIIESKNRSLAGLSVPAKALFLTNIEY